MSFVDILNIILACLIMAVIVLTIAYFYISYKNKNTGQIIQSKDILYDSDDSIK